MHNHFIYGIVEGFGIFLKPQTVDVLTRLWVTIGSAKSWGQLRESLGDQMTGMLMGIAKHTEYPGDHAPFDPSPIVQEFSRSWTVKELMQIMLRELPHTSAMADTIESSRVFWDCLFASEDAEARIVLALAGLGCPATRDDARIAQCLAVPGGPAEKSCVPSVRLG
jgi:hypothetical protein